MSGVVLVTGGSGQLGSALKGEDFAGRTVWAPTRAELDLSRPDTLAEALAGKPLAAVINAGAWTAVDAAETEIAGAWAVNAVSPGVLAGIAAGQGAAFIQVSTDYVFDGSGTAPWRPCDPIAPLNVYGASKAAGELAVRAAHPRAVIARTSWVISPGGQNFVKTVLRLAAERDALTMVADQHGAPTLASDLATALAVIARAHLADPERPGAVLHLANAGETTWCGIAQAIADDLRSRGLRAPAISPTTTDAFPRPARRPANSRLDCSDAQSLYGVALRDWRAALGACLSDIHAGAAG
jgi:dTDP-4-dehydrorhamnose reductase